MNQVLNWLVNVGPRLLSLYRRAVSEDELFQMLTEAQEARTCLEYADRAEGALVEDWDPEALRRDALQHIRRVEARLRRMSGGY